MQTSRRTFLKVAAASSGGVLTWAPAMADSPSPDKSSAPLVDPDLPRKMTLGTIRSGAGWGLAVKTEKGVLDVGAAKAALELDAPTTMHELLTVGGGASLRNLVDYASTRKRAASYLHEERDLTFGPCVTNPEKILCVGLNYRKHAAEIKLPLPTTPVLFNKFNNALNGHGGTLQLPTKVAREFDYEIELVIVMGRTARDVSEQDALEYVFGYCTGNDFSARDLQRRTSQIMLGKTCDGFAPLGPWLVTADQLPNPNTLDLWCEVNGERRQSSNTADMVFNCAQIVSYASQLMTLRPGDIIFTGTPEGVILGMPEDKRVWLKAGDRIRCAVEPLGSLEFALT